MITIIAPENREKLLKQLDEYFLRRSICNQHTWKPSALKQSLNDDFDTDKTVYIFYSDAESTDYAGLRLLPNTEPYFLKNCCSESFSENPLDDAYPSNQAIWECDRLFIDLPKSLPDYQKKLKLICKELLEALMRFGNTREILYYVTLFETETHNLLCKNSWPIIPKITSVQIREENYTQGRMKVCKVVEEMPNKISIHSLSNNSFSSSKCLKRKNSHA